MIDDVSISQAIEATKGEAHIGSGARSRLFHSLAQR